MDLTILSALFWPVFLCIILLLGVLTAILLIFTIIREVIMSVEDHREAQRIRRAR